MIKHPILLASGRWRTCLMYINNKIDTHASGWCTICLNGHVRIKAIKCESYGYIWRCKECYDALHSQVITRIIIYIGASEWLTMKLNADVVGIIMHLLIQLTCKLN